MKKIFTLVTAALASISMMGADFVPTAADMKLVASLLTPATIPKIANTKINAITTGRNVSIQK